MSRAWGPPGRYMDLERVRQAERQQFRQPDGHPPEPAVGGGVWLTTCDGCGELLMLDGIDPGPYHDTGDAECPPDVAWA